MCFLCDLYISICCNVTITTAILLPERKLPHNRFVYDGSDSARNRICDAFQACRNACSYPPCYVDKSYHQFSPHTIHTLFAVPHHLIPIQTTRPLKMLTKSLRTASTATLRTARPVPARSFHSSLVRKEYYPGVDAAVSIRAFRDHSAQV